MHGEQRIVLSTTQGNQTHLDIVFQLENIHKGMRSRGKTNTFTQTWNAFTNAQLLGRS